jgi:hypothetical protein
VRLSFCYTLIALSALGTVFAQDTNFATGPQYLINSDPTSQASPLLARSISTPSMSLAGPPLEVGASNATGVLIPGAEDRTVLPPLAVAPPKIDLFPIFYGSPSASVIEIGFPESQTPNPLPASILDAGVWLTTTAQALHERGYGVTLAQAAAYSRAHPQHATRVYTNADIARLHSGG